MKCKNRYCVHWEKKRCMLKKISVDLLGMCNYFVNKVPGDEGKRLHREELIKRWNEW